MRKIAVELALYELLCIGLVQQIFCGILKSHLRMEYAFKLRLGRVHYIASLLLYSKQFIRVSQILSYFQNKDLTNPNIMSL